MTTKGAPMEIRTFEAETMSAALQRVKAEFGADAMILHTRTVVRRRALGLRRRDVIEITAGRGMPQRPQRARAPDAPGASVPGAALLRTPAAEQVAIGGLFAEVKGLKTMLQDLITQFVQQRAPRVPEPLFDTYMSLIEQDVCRDLAEEIVVALQRQVRPEQARDESFVRRHLIEQIDRMVVSSGPIARRRAAGPEVIALVGPTGVGKTTTVAKLAANLALRERRRVGLITTDTFRIAAIDQLNKYAQIIGSPLQVATSPEEMRRCVASMADRDFVLVDTAGRSPNDAMKLNELRAFIAAAAPDELHLVVSTASSKAALDLAVDRFGAVGADRLLLTKLDEVEQIGTVLGIIQRVKKPVSYMTTGQDVPDDIELCTGRKLAERIVAPRAAARAADSAGQRT